METFDVVQPWWQHLTDTWGWTEAQSVLHCCDRLLIPFPNPVLTDQKPLIIVGERTTLPEQFAALRQVASAVFNAGPGHVLFTGGIHDREAYGETPAPDLYLRAVVEDCLPPPARLHVTVDGLSRNTGDQGRLIGKLVALHRFNCLILVYPYEHLVRLAAVLLKGIEREADKLVAQRMNIIPACYGAADTVPEYRVHRVSLAREAFGSHLPEPGEEHLTAFLKQRAGQYTTRWKESCDRNQDPNWTCGALLPSQLRYHLMTQQVQFRPTND